MDEGERGKEIPETEEPRTKGPKNQTGGISEVEVLLRFAR
jgi:hypothetical protein